ncbi:MAG: right-handed parallel beta-helix repeat-containing protein [Muribaculaceae bacterium]|nr:right-handed parallel beta-helix repeat-containing protein [Muribaculaceae bacterium]
MKKQLFLLAACVLAGAAAANATCWRINPSPFAKAQFKTVEEAMADINVLPGDTLLLDPGSHVNVDVTSRVNMTIIGTGYFLDKNKQWAESQSTVVGSARLSTGSKIEGCDAAYISLSGNGTASRCKIGNIATSGENNLVTQCYIASTLDLSPNSVARDNIILYYARGASGCIFENNIVVSGGLSGYGEPLLMEFHDSTIRNNILINTREGFDGNQVPNSCRIYYNCANNVIQNNVLSVAERYIDTNDMFKGYPNNYYVGATVENTFVNEGSDDGKWQLLDTSAAKGAATHGGDCGAFGGATPYVLSGIPMFLPHITEALVPAKPTDGKITVKLKIENQNE